MITHDFTVSRETFAADRKKVLTDAAAELAPHIKDALNRIGLPGWETPVVSAALDLFDLTARNEVDEWGPVLDDMHDAFAEELATALAKTKKAPAEQAANQASVITGWVAQMAHNAGIEAATTADPSGDVGLEWVTMHDAGVRTAHKDVDGQTVPTGHEFEVAGEKLLYPGQPVGDPSVWINCRCLARPTMLTEASVSRETLVAAGTPDAGEQVAEEEYTSTVIVALPAADDPISAASSESSGAHATLLFLGDSKALDEQALNDAVQQFVTNGEVGIITEMVNGRATLGKDAADVVLFDAANLVFIRSGLLEQKTLAQAFGSVEQFPTWLPHVTLGYPATPALAEYTGEAITFDRLAVWHGESRTEYPLGGTMPKEPDAAPADVTAAVEDAVPAPAPAAEAAPAEQLKPWHGVLAPENLPSGDSRQFAINALTSRDLPLPLKAMFQDDEGHMGSVVVGRIDEIYRDGGLIKAAGVWDISPEAEKASGMIERKMWRGVSVDLDAAEGRMVEAAEGGRESIEFSKGRVCSATLCAIPAFAEAFVRNGTWEQFANEPMPSGAMVEIPDWPGSEKAPALSLVASAAPVISADFFRNPMLEGPTPVTRGENGLIFGHLAEWSTCHIAYEICTTPPESAMQYAYFLTGQVFTDAGPVPVGQLTVGGGHAPDGISVRAAIAHYDNVATAVADITVGEDEWGIWFSGRIRPWATEQQIHELFAAGPSGDWREVYSRGSSSMELVAAHAVNVQGFPVARFAVEGGRTTSLVAAGALKPKPDAATVFADLRRMEFADVFNEISTMKGN
jgi:hypothetical protein